MDAITAIRTRRSIRDYAPETPPRALITEVLRDAVHAPWTPGSPPDTVLFTVIEGTQRIADLGARALAYTRASRPSVERYGWADRPDFSVFYNASMLVIISGNAGNPLALEECTRIGQVFSIAAHARGVGSCWVGSPNLWLSQEAVRRELGIIEPYRPLAVFTVGFPAATPPAPAAFDPQIVFV